jgi:hypothetical protein
MLHRGVFSRDLAASLAAGALVLAGVFAVSLKAALMPGHFIWAGLFFGLLFALLRIAVFHEPGLELTIDRREETVHLRERGLFGLRERRLDLTELCDLSIASATRAPSNPDGARVVEKIALGHGMVMPGFAEGEIMHHVTLAFGDERFTIYKTPDRDAAEALVANVQGFLRRSRVAAVFA